MIGSAFRSLLRGALPLATTLSIAAPAVAQPAACPFDHAVYAGPTGWTLRFVPVGRDSAANQSASFVIELLSGIELAGGIYWPNGYGAPVYSIEGPCSDAAGAESCEFLEDGGATPYVLAAGGGIERIPEKMDGPAPSQLLLPELAVSLWYSQHRGAEFDGETDPGDVFTLSGCSD
jgi:hypothetical protein